MDDDEDDFYFTTEYLRAIPDKSFDIVWAKSFDEALEKLDDCSYDVCFFDFLLGAKTGLDLLKIALEGNVDCPVVLFTSKGDNRVDQEAMRLGAMDYLVKSEIDAEKLDRTIRYALERAEVLRRLRESETRLRGIFAPTQRRGAAQTPRNWCLLLFQPSCARPFWLQRSRNERTTDARFGSQQRRF
ncbi:MAG: response regulator [Nitrospiraceae bacterium]|nr:response regulator [Nitrospiraceae bacterium]